MTMHYLRFGGYRALVLALFLLVVLTLPAQASFHLMQIEQVIGGVNGDTNAQAIQLRMRFAGQNLVGGDDLDCVRRGR